MCTASYFLKILSLGITYPYIKYKEKGKKHAYIQNKNKIEQDGKLNNC